METDDPVEVLCPTLDAILGDKLTAYGPDTTEVPLSKPMEVIKQIYDIASIFDRISSLTNVKENFISVAKTELRYRGLEDNDHQVIIDDNVITSYNYCSYGRVDADKFKTI